MCYRLSIRSLVSILTVVTLTASTLLAEPGSPGRTMAVRSRVQLAFGLPVQDVLELDEDQRIDVSEINRILKDSKTQLFQQARERKIDTSGLMAGIAKLTSEAESKLKTLLNEKQRTRLDELFVQINDVKALNDASVVKALGLSEEQRVLLERSRDENTKSLRDAYPMFRNMTKEQKKTKFESLQNQNRERMLAVLTADQRNQLEAMKGEPIDFDHSDFRIRRSRTNRTRNVSKQRAEK